MAELDNQRRIKEYNLNKTKFLENHRLIIDSKKEYFLRINENRINIPLFSVLEKLRNSLIILFIFIFLDESTL